MRGPKSKGCFKRKAGPRHSGHGPAYMPARSAQPAGVHRCEGEKPYMPNIDITNANTMQMRIVPTRIQVVLMPLRPSSQYIRPKRII